jgi:hypothetical protein
VAPVEAVVSARGVLDLDSLIDCQAMASKKTTAKAAATWRAAGAGRLKFMVVLDQEHVQALQGEALRRAQAAGSLRPDASAVLREVLDAWLKRRK